MQHETLSDALTERAFEFFFWFSRFEAALKESGYLRSEKVDAAAEPGWRRFVADHAKRYAITPAGTLLIKLAPEQQMVGPGKTLEWRPVGVDNCKDDLCKVVTLLKTLRNNVFHGGKSGGAGWDQPDRTRELLDAGTTTLHELADLAGIKADLWQRY